MTDRKRDHASESEEVQIRKIELRWAFFGKIVENGFKWGVLAFGFWRTTEAWIATAGTTTIANLSASLKVETIFETITTWTWPLLIVFGAGGIAYGRREAKLKKDAIERLHPYQEKYEKLVDPNRTSSRLTSRGETHPEDR